MRTLSEILKLQEKEENILDYMIWDDKGVPIIPTAKEFLLKNSHKTNEENLIEYAKIYSKAYTKQLIKKLSDLAE